MTVQILQFMYETIRIVGKLRPKYVIWENVKNLLNLKVETNNAYTFLLKRVNNIKYIYNLLIIN